MESREALVAPGSRYYNYTAGPAARDCLLTVKCVGRFTYLPGYALTRRSFDSYLLEVILDGSLTLQTGGQDYPANRGDAVLLDCHSPHAYRSRQGWQALWLHFDGPGAAGYYRWITRGGSPVLHPADFAGLCGALGRIYRLFEAGLVPGEGLLAREVTAALGCLLDPGPGAAPDPLDQVLYAITTNLDKEMTVRELADLAHFSEYHFIRLFRARVGMTPRQYLIAARMERARYLLKATNLPLQAISEQVGYASDNVFCTQFKRRYGLTPTEFRLG